MLGACSSSGDRGEQPAAGDTDVSSADPDSEAGAEEEGRSPADEAQEEAQLTSERIDAHQAALADGSVGRELDVVNHPAPGWNGEQLLAKGTDDWEPAVAADPNDPYVYMLTTRYGEPKTCSSHCPSPFLPLTVSSDGGKTWSDQKPLCVCRGAGAQYDPTIEVVPNTGAVYSAFLNADRAGGFSTAFIRSEDHGKTWTDPVHVYGKVSWTDKPTLTSSANGKDVYVSFNGPQGGDPYMAVSHDYGKTWTQQKLVTSKRYYYAYDATVLPDGTVVFAESSEVYGGSKTTSGAVWHHAIISHDHGKTWDNVILSKVKNGEPCVAAGCSPDFYTGQASVASDPSGNLVFAYEGASRNLGPQQVYTQTSTDEGKTWGHEVAVSRLGENATGPRLDFAGNGQARLWYMQTSNGDDPDAWNVWFRSSSDGGKSWSGAARLSDATAGPRYITQDGFKEIYGDYGEIAVTSAGKTIAVWGEGFSYVGPGGTWYALQK